MISLRDLPGPAAWALLTVGALDLLRAVFG
jgi:hypothetical protein